MEKIVVLGSTLAPSHDPRALKALFTFIGEWQPDEIIQIGPAVDDSETEISSYLECFIFPLRETYAGPVKVIDPVLSTGALEAVDGFTSVEEPYEFTPDWVAVHGGYLELSLSRLGGRTALLAANRIRKNVAMGGSPLLGLMGESFGYEGKITTQWGMEVGHLMDMKSAHYLKHGAANWQQGFGLFYVDGDDVKPEIVPVFPNGTFIVDGYRFGDKRSGLPARGH